MSHQKTKTVSYLEFKLMTDVLNYAMSEEHGDSALVTIIRKHLNIMYDDVIAYTTEDDYTAFTERLFEEI